jgi:hypothetical protein
MAEKDRKDSVPESFHSLREAGEFWDTHSAADYWGLFEETELEFDIERRTYLVPLSDELYQRIKAHADTSDRSVEELVDSLLKSELDKIPSA